MSRKQRTYQALVILILSFIAFKVNIGAIETFAIIMMLFAYVFEKDE